MKRSILFIIPVLVIFSCSPKVAEFVSADITKEEIMQHVKYLASDGLQGRKSGEAGNREAARYIADRFKEYGLLPSGDSATYFQEFSFVSSTRVGPENKFEIRIGDEVIVLKPNSDYKPLSSSLDTSLTTNIVFAGFGISAPESLKYDDYKGVDLKGKLALILRGSPDTSVADKFYQQSGLMAKLFNARDKGAAGIIFITGMPGGKGDNFGAFEDPRAGNTGMPVLSLRWEVAEKLLEKSGNNLAGVKAGIESDLSPRSFELAGYSVNLTTQIEKIRARTSNVVGFIPGADTLLKDEVVLLGAHFDHLGMGGEGSGSLTPDTVAPHNGADDNASGTAGLLELAQYFGTRKATKRSLIFVAFTGEELGILGSDYYVRHPFMPLEKSVTMVNMDMIGRMKDSILVIEGMGTSPEFEALVKSENLDSLSLKLKPDGFGPSDQASFYKKDLPVLFFFTNLHSDYHKPSDTWDKLNYSGEQKVVEMAKRVVARLANQEKRPAFTKTSTPTMGGDRQGARVTLGIIPDFASDVPGMKISGARPGSPAEKAGLKADDVIIKFGGKEIKNIYDFTYMLGQFKPGDIVDIVVKRGTDELTVKATLVGK